MLLQVLEITAPVFFLALIGYVWKRTGHHFDIPFVSRMSMQIAVPALIFSVLSRIEIEPRAFADLAFASLALYAAIAAGAWVVVRGAGLPMRVYLAPMTFANTGNVGLPIALFAYGETGLAYAMVVFAVMAALSFTVGIWMVAGAASPLAVLKEPIFHASWLGILFAAQGWGTPDVVAKTLELTGQIAIPIMLITLGVAVAQLEVHAIGRALALALAKALLCGLIGVAVAASFGLTGAAAGALVLQAITPVAVTNYLLATRYGAQPDAVASLVVVSTVLSVLVIPATLAALL